MMDISTVIKTEPPAPPTLSAVDRCDRCGAQAYVAVGNDTGELQFCKHHAERYLAVLTDQGFEITVDQRELLNA